MFKIAVSVFCLFLVHKSVQGASEACESGKCCIPGVGSYNSGQLVSDPNGICQQYACHDGGYSIYNCPVYSAACELEDGKPGALYPECCSQLPNKAQPEGCSGVA